MLFAPKRVDPAKKVREWKKEISREMRGLDREILKIDRAENKTKLEIKKAAARNDMVSAKILAKEVAQARKAKSRLYTSKAQLNSISMGLQSTLANVRIAGCLQQSTQVMESINQVIRLPELHKVMMNLGKEMEKAGLIEEMTTEMFEDLEDDSIEEAADEEVEKVFLEITQGILEHGGRVGGTLEKKKQEEKEKEDAMEQLARIEVPTM